ncbi:MAG: hypothetical protein WAT23_04570 [Chromatiaceae bacterium]
MNTQTLKETLKRELPDRAVNMEWIKLADPLSSLAGHNAAQAEHDTTRRDVAQASVQA